MKRYSSMKGGGATNVRSMPNVGRGGNYGHRGTMGSGAATPKARGTMGSGECSHSVKGVQGKG